MIDDSDLRGDVVADDLIDRRGVTRLGLRGRPVNRFAFLRLSVRASSDVCPYATILVITGLTSTSQRRGSDDPWLARSDLSVKLLRYQLFRYQRIE